MRSSGKRLDFIDSFFVEETLIFDVYTELFILLFLHGESADF